MAPLMFVTELTGRASILMRPPDISSTMPFQSRNSSWKMSLPAHPDWIFHVMVCAVATPPPAPAAGEELAAPLAPGAFCGRQAAMNAPIAESEKYLRNPRREELGSFTIRTSHFPPARGRATIRFRLFPHVKRPFSPGATAPSSLPTSPGCCWTHFWARRDPGEGLEGGRLPRADAKE